MDFLDFKNKTAKTNLLNEVDVLGPYDFYTSIISLDSLKEHHAAEASRIIKSMPNFFEFKNSRKISGDEYVALAKVLPLVYHEYTHFIDANSTCWGLDYLKKMSSAYSSRSGKENVFCKAKEFFDYSRCIRLPKYYTVIDKRNGNLRPWRSDVTIGHLFSSSGVPTKNSIIFSRFSNRQGDLLVRSPISTVSLLEASAMAQEIYIQNLLLKCCDSDFQVVERKLIEEKTVQYLYNPNLTEYSVCAHIVANKMGTPDVSEAFRACTILTRFVLNFPEWAFDQIAKFCPVSDVLGVAKGHPFCKSVKTGLEHRNYGIAYYLLCSALPSNFASVNSSIKPAISRSLRVLRIDMEELMEMSSMAIERAAKELVQSEISTIANLAEAGMKNYRIIDPFSCEINFSKLHLPPALLGDSEKFNLFSSDENNLSDFDLDQCFNEMYAGQEWVERFSESCI